VKAPIHAICRPEVALGLALAGVAPIEAATGAEAGAALAALAHEPGRGGVVLIEQGLYDALPAATRRALRKAGEPILMPFPGPGRALGAAPDDELLEILRRAVGYRVRVR
jgi:vacuolar-type H+-ATPase subunit F/Vma7